MLYYHFCVFLRGPNVNGDSVLGTNIITVQKRAPSRSAGKGKYTVDAAIEELILMCVRGKVICNITLSVESQKQRPSVPPLVSLCPFVSLSPARMHKHIYTS